MDDTIINADDVVARLKEEIKKLEVVLMKDGFNDGYKKMPDLKRREISQKIITYNRILHGDKPIDKC